MVVLFLGEDVVVMMLWIMGVGGFFGQIFVQYWCVGCLCFEGVNDDGKFFVFDFDQFDCIGGYIVVICDDEGDFLILEQNFVVCENYLYIVCQCWYLVQVQWCEVGGCEYCYDVWQCFGFFVID